MTSVRVTSPVLRTVMRNFAVPSFTTCCVSLGTPLTLLMQFAGPSAGHLAIVIRGLIGYEGRVHPSGVAVGDALACRRLGATTTFGDLNAVTNLVHL